MSMLRAAATVSSFTLLSRITGLARDIVIARAFGAGALTDAFWVAFRIPNLLRRLFAEGAFSQAFVPILGQVRNEHAEQPEAIRVLLDRVALTLFLALFVITLIGVIGAPWVVMAMASGLTNPARAAEFDAAVWMTRLMFPYIPRFDGSCVKCCPQHSGCQSHKSRYSSTQTSRPGSRLAASHGCPLPTA